MCEVSPDMSLRVLSAGDRSRNRGTLVFMHGLGARADRWAETLQACAEAGWLTVAFDFPGHGHATKGRSRYLSVAGFAECAAAVCRTLDAERLTLVGTSLGGHIAAEMTVAEPGRTERLVLVGPIGIAPETTALRARLATAIADTTRSGIEGKLNRVVFDHTLVTDEWIDEEFAINNSDGATDSFAALADYFLTEYGDHVIGTKLLEAAPNLPCLLIWGADDQLVPAGNATSVGELLPPGAQTHFIQRSGHAPYFDRPMEFQTVLLNFLSEEQPQRRI